MNVIDLAIVVSIFFLSILAGFAPKLIKKIQNIRYINAVRKQNKRIKSISSEYDDYEDDYYVLELEKNEFELSRLKSPSHDSHLDMTQANTSATATSTLNKSYDNSIKPNFLMNSISLCIGFQTSITLIGLPVEFYYYGFQSFQFCFSVLLAPVLISAFFVPFLYKLKSKSIYEYLNDKFDTGSHSVKIFILVLIILFQFMFASLVLFSSSLTIIQMISFNKTTISLWHCALVLGLTSALLAMLGLKSIIWANFLQYLIIIGCNISIIVIGLRDLSPGSASVLEGFKLAWNITEQTNRNTLFTLNENTRFRYTLWNCLIGLTFNAIPSYCLTQQSYQRIKQAKSVTSARVLVLSIIPFGFMNLFLILSIGFIMFVFFHKCGDPILSGDLNNQNQLLASFLNKFYAKYTGLLGFFLACLISSTVGTLASIFKGLATNLVEDIISKLDEKKNNKQEQSQENMFRRRVSARKLSLEKNDSVSFEKQLLNIQAKWNPNRKKKKLLKKYAAKYNKKFAYRNITLLSILLSSLATILIAIGLEFIPGSLTSTAFSILNVFHGPILFVYLCARFNDFALRRNHFALNTRSTASKIKNLTIHYIDLILSCCVSIILVACLYTGQIWTYKDAINFYNFDKLPFVNSNNNRTNFTSTISTQICQQQEQQKRFLNDTLSLNRTFSTKMMTTTSEHASLDDYKLTMLNYLFAISFNWYPLIGFLICCISLIILSMIRFIYVFFFCCKKRSIKI